MSTNWTLLTDTRNRLLRYWDITAAVLLAFLLIQQTTGLIEGALLEVWRWYFLSILPCLLLLHYSAWSRRHTDRIISQGTHQSVYWLSVAYMSLLFIIFFLSRAAIDHNDYGFSQYFTRLLSVTLPFSLLLCVGYWLLFYKHEPLFKPTPAALMAVASEKATIAQKQRNEIQYACYESIRTNDFDNLFILMDKAHKEQQFSEYNALLTLQSQYSHLKHETGLQTVDEATARVQLNRITLALIELIAHINK